MLQQAQRTASANPGGWRVWLKTARSFSLSASVSPVVVNSSRFAWANIRCSWPYHPTVMILFECMSNQPNRAPQRK